MRRNKWIALCFLGIIVLFFMANVHMIIEPANEYLDEELEFSEFIDEIQNELQSDKFPFKNQFINFNGWFSRVLGKREINGVVKAENGVLFTPNKKRTETGLHGQKVANTNAVLQKMGKGIPFIYVQAPYKVDLNKEILPDGIKNYYNDSADSLLAEMEYRGVRTMDLRPAFSATAKDIERNFFRTDHHWKYSAAFEAFQMLVPVIQEMLNDYTDVSLYTDKANWESHVIPQAFLGSQGKRVGVYVAGLDDFEYYTPKFETEMTLQIIHGEKWFEGDFAECIIRDERLKRLEKYFERNPYAAYIGGDYGLIEHRNKRAAVDKKILIIKDSFALPIQSFLSTIYKEIDVVDLRNYKQTSLLELIYMSRPDMVFLLHTSISELPRYSYGYEEWEQTIKRMEIDKNNPLIALEMETLGTKSAPEYVTIYEDFECDTMYTFEFDSLTNQSDEKDHVVARLYDESMGRILAGRYFDAAETDENGRLKWCFKTPDTDCSNVYLQIFRKGSENESTDEDKAPIDEKNMDHEEPMDVENIVLYRGWDIPQEW